MIENLDIPKTQGPDSGSDHFVTEQAEDGVDLLTRVLTALDASSGSGLRLMHKHGRILCALPDDPELASRTLALYSPQRLPGKIATTVVRLAMKGRCLRLVLPKVFREGEGGRSCGVLLGSAGHQIERAVAVLAGDHGPEVAKVAFGRRGREALETEAAMLEAMSGRDAGAPEFLGIKPGDEVTVLRMKWEAGHAIGQGCLGQVLPILESWLADESPKRFGSYAEWPLVERRVREQGFTNSWIDRLSEVQVVGSIRHGDFTTWNMRMAPGGELRIHDWERGVLDGPAGFDLVHYLTQDALLVRRLAPRRVVESVRAELMGKAAGYLAKAGWQGEVDALMTAVFSFTTEAGYQDQSELMEVMRELKAL